jgi:two-component system, chemotaxis family, protein-glutamate methylesterase/glutaminase
VPRLRVLVADDSLVFRKALSDVLAALPDVEVVGTAANGRMAVQRVKDLAPDLLTLDMEMPEMDGIAVLEALRSTGSKTAVIVVSALTRKGGALTMKALERGAFDFITKPDTSSAEASRESITRELAPRIRALAHRMEVRNILRGGPPVAAPPPPPAVTRPAMGPGFATGAGPASPDIQARMNRIVNSNRPDLVLIGVSTGGPQALTRVLPELPANMGVPVLVVQHMPPLFTQSLADSLAARCHYRVKEAADGDLLDSRTIYIAPGGRQMKLGQTGDGGRVIQITDDPPENNCRPAVDYLFRSVAHVAPGRAMAVVLTGMGSDGMLGLKLLKRHGCFAIAQDEASCVVYGMPKAVVDAGLADAVLPLDAIAARISATVRGAKG